MKISGKFILAGKFILVSVTCCLSFMTPTITKAGPLENGIAQRINQDYVRARASFRLAIEQGSLEAKLRLGRLHEFGRGGEKSLKKAMELYREAAEQGDAFGQYNLGRMYEQGKGVPKSIEIAILWYEKSAAQDGSAAKGRLKALDAKGVTKLSGIDRLLKTAQAGDAASQFKLAQQYGDGNKQGYSAQKAKYWLSKAAENGFPLVQSRVGSHYSLGSSGIESRSRTQFTGTKRPLNTE